MADAPERIWTASTEGKCHVGFATPSMNYTNEYIRADLMAELVEALRKLHHAVCGETGFAACVRLDSGKAYPWPALDDADETAAAVLAKIKEATP